MSDVGIEIKTLLHARDSNLIDMLGPHVLPAGGVRILAYLPGADAVSVIRFDQEAEERPMESVLPDGIFQCLFADTTDVFPYKLRITRAGSAQVTYDPYAYPPLISALDLLTIAEGNNVQAFEVLGAHPRKVAGTPGVHFAVWAPHARWLSVIGDFNDWDTNRYPLRRRGDGGIWELFVPEVEIGARYKFHIESKFKDYVVDKADPYGFSAELRPQTASIVADLKTYEWGDETWMTRRKQSASLESAISIYEVHLGSWRRSEDGGFLNYHELAHQLVDYVKSMGFSHIELMPITEHPFDVSWGYQTTGYYAVTSRFGTPQDFMYFVDYCHLHDIGVFLDWVPSHFAKEEQGLGFFDGAHIYEHADPRQGEHFDWGTFVFNYGRGEVQSFLLSNAVFWLQQYHIDGLRVDAVASMLYLDHQRSPGAWVRNKYGGRENLEAIEFLRRFNGLVQEKFPGAITMAEESTSWPRVTGPVYLGGLGFTLKWNMGWMHDTLEYIKADPIHRRFIHNSITFSMLYNYSENFLLPLSHDEVVHGKSPLVYKAPGDEWQKFATLRLLLGYMWAHPGKKLLFMGGEFGQTSEWNYATSLRWDLLQYPAHSGMQLWARELNSVYKSRPELYTLDYDPIGFEWIDNKDVNNSILIMMRRGEPDQTLPAIGSIEPGYAVPGARDGATSGVVRDNVAGAPASQQLQQRADAARPFVIIACNFTPVVRDGYTVGVPVAGRYREILNSDARQYGGSGVINEGFFDSQPARIHDREQAIVLTLPPLGVSFLELAKD
ncbi:MAG: glgB [Chloroflexi bacterium]|nr:glgB [Chloroflexota bacterium]